MLAEQHCVCTKSGLKNVFSTRCVVGRWGWGGQGSCFEGGGGEHRAKASSSLLPSSASFPLLSGAAGSLALRLLILPSSESSSSQEHHQPQSTPGALQKPQKKAEQSCGTGYILATPSRHQSRKKRCLGHDFGDAGGSTEPPTLQGRLRKHVYFLHRKRGFALNGKA